MKRLLVPFILFWSLCGPVRASQILIPMDEAQKNHLKAYGLAYWVLKNYETEVEWLLNYRGGSFMFQENQKFQNELVIRGISYDVISDGQAQQIRQQLQQPDVNMDVVKLQKAPKIAVYSPKTNQPWDDAVTLVLTYAEIPYETLYDDEIMGGKLPGYDWLHLHHEDFTGQMGKFWQHRNYPYYQIQKREGQETAAKYGLSTIPQLKLAVTHKIREFVSGGGYMFAMCNATDTYDIALAANGVDFVDPFYDGTPADPTINQKLDFSQTFAFQDFKVFLDPYQNEFSSIDNQKEERQVGERNDYFELFQFSAKWDPVPTMLTQDHATSIKGFMGLTTAFKKQYIKPEVVVLGENRSLAEARYIHGTFGKGFWTFYGGHDPEDYEHHVGEEPTDLTLHPNSAGYRLILNNILFPAAKKKKMKT
ncbi:asparagine synthetase B [Siphonobacter aquaeclarae]|jgi:hypothetical protein|uniref:Asparagine synthetase B n=1 Tax=Siphonobacter aquaeclarae TaxID=563176 RepID=A0A1G9K604_9BACT|nr:asparagine synthetase B [Siphonobacter aquaeclarae]MBO9637656.1 asparagine synthetase B [Siphonobacter aquaeclarae]SDL44795.1 hypothetical protein SAMN04488090_0881 [Siphonobacter aquaeclarae]